MGIERTIKSQDVSAFRYFDAFIRLFYPRICLSCNTDLYAGEHFICLHCRAAMVPTGHADFRENPVYQLLRPHFPVHYAAAAHSYGSGLVIQRLLHAVKYRGDRDLAVHLGRLLADTLSGKPGWTDLDLLVPLPLHRQKQARRGFNQSELICRGMREVLEIPVCSEALIRTRRTSTQTSRGRSDRWENAMGSFGLIHETRLEGKRIILVDDVITTGATITAALHALGAVPGIRIHVAAVAYSGDL